MADDINITALAGPAPHSHIEGDSEGDGLTEELASADEPQRNEDMSIVDDVESIGQLIGGMGMVNVGGPESVLPAPSVRPLFAELNVENMAMPPSVQHGPNFHTFDAGIFPAAHYPTDIAETSSLTAPSNSVPPLHLGGAGNFQVLAALGALGAVSGLLSAKRVGR